MSWDEQVTTKKAPYLPEGGDQVPSYLFAIITPVPTLPEKMKPASTTDNRIIPLQFLIIPRGIP